MEAPAISDCRCTCNLAAIAPVIWPQLFPSLFEEMPCNQLQAPCTDPYAPWCGRGRRGDRRPYAAPV